MKQKFSQISSYVCIPYVFVPTTFKYKVSVYVETFRETYILLTKTKISKTSNLISTRVHFIPLRFIHRNEYKRTKTKLVSNEPNCSTKFWQEWW